MLCNNSNVVTVGSRMEGVVRCCGVRSGTILCFKTCPQTGWLKALTSLGWLSGSDVMGALVTAQAGTFAIIRA